MSVIVAYSHLPYVDMEGFEEAIRGVTGETDFICKLNEPKGGVEVIGLSSKGVKSLIDCMGLDNVVEIKEKSMLEIAEHIGDSWTPFMPVPLTVLEWESYMRERGKLSDAPSSDPELQMYIFIPPGESYRNRRIFAVKESV